MLIIYGHSPEWDLHSLLLDGRIFDSLVNDSDIGLLFYASFLQGYVLADDGVLIEYLDVLNIWAPATIISDNPPDL